MSMDAARWERIKTVFQSTFDADPAERAGFLDAACGDDRELRDAVQRLLDGYADAGAFLEAPLQPESRSASLRGERERLAERVGLHDSPTRIGQYRVIRELGRGGMGTVYLAERDDPALRKTVAIKVVRVESPLILRRFQTETRILAGIEHSGIARLYDGGTTDDGLPYFVMEYVAGENIVAYCNAQQLSIADRLRLFRRVCEAVQFAHQSFIVHRDLKPSNILLTAEGEPKLLDFGIAKLLNSERAEGPLDETMEMIRLLTPQYASPEHVRGQRVTTASDVYSLGLILFELLCGQRPYRVTSELSTAEMERIVCEQEPAPPSSVAPPNVRRALRGDLDNIVLKALRKAPADRYATAAELADDVRRHLEGFPVQAQPDRVAYRAGKFVRRHRVVVAAVSVTVLSLVAGLAAALWEARIARLERDRANARFADVRKLANALIFKIHDGVAPLAGSTPVRQMIVSEALTYLEQLSRDSGADDALRLELARGYHRIGDVQGRPSVPNLGDRQGAHTSYVKAVALLRSITSGAVAREAALELGRIDLSLGDVLIQPNREEVQAAIREALTTAERLVRADPSDDDARRLLGSAHFQLALSVDQAESLPEWKKAGAVFDGLLAERPEDPDRRRNVALVQKYIGNYYQAARDYAAAQPYYERALDLDEKRLAADPASRSASFDVAVDLSSVAFSKHMTGRLTEAIADFERCLRIREKLAEADPQDVQARRQLKVVHDRLGSTYVDQGRVTEALAEHHKAVAIGESLFKIDALSQVDLADSLLYLGSTEVQAGHRTASCQTFRRGFNLMTNVLGQRGLPGRVERRAADLRSNFGDRIAQCPAR